MVWVGPQPSARNLAGFTSSAYGTVELLAAGRHQGWHAPLQHDWIAVGSALWLHHLTNHCGLIEPQLMQGS